MSHATATPPSLEHLCETLALRARSAARALTFCRGQQKNDWLGHTATTLEKRQDEILQANAEDVAAAEGQHSAAFVDRLRLTPARLKAAAEGLRQVALLPDPI